ncbi:MAG TPA: sugar phosphate nucleotidyltransferase, partial [Candidatus Acidoferrum sp.]|nr:sugar phosphate nucleotidyltransferase [Candidatus Acidoferrum sp.]
MSVTRRLPTKAIIAAAGTGMRFLPQTKAIPKELLPIVDKPIIQIIVEQLVEAGVDTVIIVTSYTKRALEDHFDRSEALEEELRSNGRGGLAEQMRYIAEMANFVYLRQKGPYGSAQPVINARHLIDYDEPFYVIFPDDFFRCEVPYPKQLLESYQETGGSTMSLVGVRPEDTAAYGMAVTEGRIDDRTYKVTGFIEKPGQEKTPSLFASAGSFLLTPAIWPFLERLKPGHGGGMVLGDAIGAMAAEKPVFGRVIK